MALFDKYLINFRFLLPNSTCRQVGLNKSTEEWPILCSTTSCHLIKYEWLYEASEWYSRSNQPYFVTRQKSHFALLCFLISVSPSIHFVFSVIRHGPFYSAQLICCCQFWRFPRLCGAKNQLPPSHSQTRIAILSLFPVSCGIWTTLDIRSQALQFQSPKPIHQETLSASCLPLLASSLSTAPGTSSPNGKSPQPPPSGPSRWDIFH